MRKLIYSFGVSLDGFIAGPNGEIDWSAPDDELHRFYNQQARELGAELYGRRLWEVMRVWETWADDRPSAPEAELEFARIWKDTPKIVFSRTLEKVEGNATLVREDAAEEVARLKEQPGGNIAVLGSGQLVQTLIEHDLVDEFFLAVFPIVLGSGKRLFREADDARELRLVDSKATSTGGLLLTYRPA
jgi:dihydrofolate reductase